MLNANHPDDERLAALSSHDPDASVDQALTAHVSECSRCTDVVGELSSLRVALAGLPDVAPPRPLRLLPDVVPAPTDGAAGWAKRLFGPVMAAGAALALVGMIGTASPSLSGSAASGGAEEHQVMATDSDANARSTQAAPAVGGESLGSGDGFAEPGAAGEPDDAGGTDAPETCRQSARSGRWSSSPASP